MWIVIIVILLLVLFFAFGFPSTNLVLASDNLDHLATAKAQLELCGIKSYLKGCQVSPKGLILDRIPRSNTPSLHVVNVKELPKAIKELELLDFIDTPN